MKSAKEWHNECTWILDTDESLRAIHVGTIEAIQTDARAELEQQLAQAQAACDQRDKWLSESRAILMSHGNEIHQLREQLGKAITCCDASVGDAPEAIVNGFAKSQGWLSHDEAKALQNVSAELSKRVNNLETELVVKHNEAKRLEAGAAAMRLALDETYDLGYGAQLMVEQRSTIAHALNSTNAGKDLIAKMERYAALLNEIQTMTETPSQWPLTQSEMARWITGLCTKTREALKGTP